MEKSSICHRNRKKETIFKSILWGEKKKNMASAPGQAAYEANCGCEEKKCWLKIANQVVICITYCSVLCFTSDFLPLMFIALDGHALFILFLL